jgi:hypothetical protein
MPPDRVFVDSYAALLDHEPEILRRIEALPNGGALFLIHPFSLFEDIGVDLSENAKAEILAAEPRIAGLSTVPYAALKSSESPQRYRIHLEGLFQRRAV